MTSVATTQDKPPPRSLHHRILTEIEDKILSGEWPPGFRIPFEHELTARYNCSRMTVNKAMTQLANAGLIVRRRRAGSFVTRPQSQSAVLQIQELESEVHGLGLAYRYEMIERRKRRATRQDRERLGLAAPTPVLRLATCHFAGRQPFCLEQRLINLRTVPDADAEHFAEIPPGTWLARSVRWTAAEHRIRASAADDTVAALLKLMTGSPCLVIERRTWSADQSVTFVRLTYPGDAHELVARFHP